MEPEAKVKILPVILFLICLPVLTLPAGGDREIDTAEMTRTGERETEVDYPVTIEDDFGQFSGQENRVIVLEKPMERLIVGEKGCALTLLELGAADRVVGAGDWIVKEIPGYEDTQSIGGTYIDIELIIGLNPDIFISLANIATQSVAPLIQAGIPIYTVKTVKNLEHIKKHIADYGLMVGKQKAAQAIIDEMNRKESKADDLVSLKNLSEENKPEVFMFGPMGDMRTLQTWAPAGGTLIEDLITKAGGRCLTAEQGLNGWPQYSLEKLLESDPDIIILPISEAEFSSVKEFTSMDLVQGLHAVKTNRVYGIDTSLVWDMSFKTATALLKFVEFINE